MAQPLLDIVSVPAERGGILEVNGKIVEGLVSSLVRSAEGRRRGTGALS
jgi:hypothetical protein